MIESREAQLAVAVLARDAVRRIALRLAEHDISVMPLKGVLLHALVYDDPRGRPMSDVDLLVPRGRFLDATRALERSGYLRRGIGPAGSSVLLRSPHARVDVDLHARLFPPGLFRMSTESMFEHARVSDVEFGAAVRLPSSLDLYAHLVGHFVKGRHGREDVVHLDDLAHTAARLDLGAADVAAHLRRCGLARAARYVLPLASERGDSFAAAVLERMPVDAAGDVLAAGARASMNRARRAAALWPHALNATLPRAAASLALHAGDVVLRRWRG